MAIQTFPRPVNPKIKKQTDDQLAKVGQLNQLVKDVNALNVTGPSPVGYGFEWYPEAGLTTGGVKFRYTDGVEMMSYHIKGVYSVGNSGNGFEVYLCSVNFPGGQPFIMPGSLTGMFQSGANNDIITSPLANGGLVELNGAHVPVSNLQAILSAYGNNPQPDGSYNYALLISATVENPDNYTLTALMAYDFEFLLPNFETAPTIFQD